MLFLQPFYKGPFLKSWPILNMDTSIVTNKKVIIINKNLEGIRKAAPG